MTADEFIARARSMLGKKTVYALGRGGFRPNDSEAFDVLKRCDCSGFVAWAMRTPRQFSMPWYGYAKGEWLSTASIVKDACDPSLGLFDRVDKAESGMLYVWSPHAPDEPYGHVGIITQVDDVGPSRIIHCSHGNYRNTGDAIQETDASIFVLHKALVAHVAGIVYGPVNVGA